MSRVVFQAADNAIIGGNVFGGFLCSYYVCNLLPLIEVQSDFRLSVSVLFGGLLFIVAEQVRRLDYALRFDVRSLLFL